LTVRTDMTSTINETVCYGSSYTSNGFNVINAIIDGVYTLPQTDGNGCDNTITLNLTVNPILTRTINATISEGETYNFYGTPFTTAVTGGEHRFNETGCDSLVILNLTVTPNECAPLTGIIAGNNMICEGNSVTLDASSYKADYYIWRSEGDFTGERSGSGLTVTPTAGFSTYRLEMTLGDCKYYDDFTVEVISLPRIAYIDSIGSRDRKIVIDEQYGLPPYSYGVNQQATNSSAEKYNLNFSVHTFHVVDALGCKSFEVTHTVAAPYLIFPPYFSPNGDGINDTWEVTGLSENYPQAVVTIFDRYGKELVKYKGADTGWDGIYQGTVMPSTDYWYQVDVEGINKPYVGHFTLLRR